MQMTDSDFTLKDWRRRRCSLANGNKCIPYIWFEHQLKTKIMKYKQTEVIYFNFILWSLIMCTVSVNNCNQWRHQDLLRGGANMEIYVMGLSRRAPGPAAAAAR